MIAFTTSNSKEDLEGILLLQKANLAVNLPIDEVRSQGFVTVTHTYEQLLQLTAYEKHVVAKDGDKVVGYILAMTEKSKEDIPILAPLFDAFDNTHYKGRKIADYHYIVVGQVCIDKLYRGQGLLEKCYAAYKALYSDKYDFAVTEIAESNTRSLNAHKKIGFEEIHRYTSPDNTEWVIVVWDWGKGS